MDNDALLLIKSFESNWFTTSDLYRLAQENNIEPVRLLDIVYKLLSSGELVQEKYFHDADGIEKVVHIDDQSTQGIPSQDQLLLMENLKTRWRNR